MLNNEQTTAIEPAKRILLIIFAGLVLGVIFFALVTSVVRLNDDEPLFNMELGTLAMIGVAFAALVVLPSFIVPMIIQKATIKDVANRFAGNLGDAQAAKQMIAGLQTSMIVGLALLEGAAFFNIIAFMLEGSLYNILAACGLLYLMLIRIPLPTRIENKIANMLDDAKHQ